MTDGVWWKQPLAQAATSGDSAALLRKEKAILGTAMKKGDIPHEKIGAAIQSIMTTRHNKERQQMMTAFAKQKTEALTDALRELADAQDRDKRRISGLPKEQQTAALQKLERAYAMKQLAAQKEVRQQLSESHNQRRLALKKKQLEEVFSAYKEHAPAEAQEQFTALEEARIAAQLQQEKDLQVLRGKSTGTIRDEDALFDLMGDDNMWWETCLNRATVSEQTEPNWDFLKP